MFRVRGNRGTCQGGEEKKGNVLIPIAKTGEIHGEMRNVDIIREVQV